MGRTAIVAGAGVIGIASAYALARRGWAVRLVDRADGPAMGTSHANGAQLSYCFTDALGSPWTLAALPRLLLRNDGVSFRLGMEPDYLRWLASFLRNCSLTRFRQNTLALLDLAAQSRVAMEQLCKAHELDFGHRVVGKINLLYSPEEQHRADLIRSIKQQGGAEQFLLPREEMTQLDPALVDLDPAVIGAVSTPSEVVGDPFQFCAEMRRVLENDYGVQCHFGEEISGITEIGSQTRIEMASGEVLTADLAVVAGGMGSQALLGPLGEAGAIQPMKGYSFEMPLTDGSPRISVTDGKRRLVFTHLGDRMRVAGIAELGNASPEIETSRIDWMVRSAKECLPKGGDYDRAGSFWTGIRPMTPTTQPIIRRASKTLTINTGHGALGWTLAMGSGERLAELLD